MLWALMGIEGYIVHVVDQICTYTHVVDIMFTGCIYIYTYAYIYRYMYTILSVYSYMYM